RIRRGLVVLDLLPFRVASHAGNIVREGGKQKAGDCEQEGRGRKQKLLAGRGACLRGSCRYRLPASSFLPLLRLHHVLEPQPLLVEVQIHIRGGTVAILEDQQLGGAFLAGSGGVELLAV